MSVGDGKVRAGDAAPVGASAGGGIGAPDLTHWHAVRRALRAHLPAL